MLSVGLPLVKKLNSVMTMMIMMGELMKAILLFCMMTKRRMKMVAKEIYYTTATIATTATGTLPTIKKTIRIRTIIIEVIIENDVYKWKRLIGRREREIRMDLLRQL